VPGFFLGEEHLRVPPVQMLIPNGRVEFTIKLDGGQLVKIPNAQPNRYPSFEMGYIGRSACLL
jgi:hypothetical protein